MTGLFTAILNMSITASYIVLAVIAIRVPLKKVPKLFSYVLWLPVLVRLVFPFSFISKVSFFNFLRLSAQMGTGAMKYVPNNIGLMQKPAVDAGIKGMLSSAAPTASSNPTQMAMKAASIIWVIGMAILFIYSIISYLKVINNVKTATLVKDNIFVTDRITTPFVIGFIKPKIFIPVGLGENELAYILSHEKTHIKRLDYLIKPFAYLVLVVHWFNPLVWISFLLMCKDMEMSCDENVVKEMGNAIKVSYANSLLSLSVKRSGLLTGSPLAFGESDIKSRIKNILNFKKPAFWVIAVTIAVIAVLMVGFTTNPENRQSAAPDSYKGYDREFLIAGKTLYVGDNSKVVALIDAMPLPAGIRRGKVELHTEKPPYGITINLIMNAASGVTEQGAVSGNDFYRNSVLLFSLIDNADKIDYKISDNTGNYNGASYNFTFTREMAEKSIGEDVRHYADSTQTLKVLIDRLENVSFHTEQTSVGEQVEKYLKIITSSPAAASNPYDYIKAHRNEYENVIKMGDEALNYLLSQFEKGGNNNDLRGHIMMALCKELLGDRNNVKDQSLLPEEWFSRLSL